MSSSPLSTAPHSPSRRAVARGLAWTVPSATVAMAAPAYAASPCEARVLKWSGYPVGTIAPSPIGVPNSAMKDPVSVTHTVSTSGSTVAGPQADQVQAGPQSAVDGNWWRLSMGKDQNPTATGWSIRTTWNFNRPVTNLKFSVLDIDYVSGSSGWSDRVYLTSGFTAVRGGYITGNGTAADEWYSTGDFNAGGHAGGNRVDVTYAGPITSFTLVYTCGNRASGTTNMHVGLSNLTFCA